MSAQGRSTPIRVVGAAEYADEARSTGRSSRRGTTTEETASGSREGGYYIVLRGTHSSSALTLCLPVDPGPWHNRTHGSQPSHQRCWTSHQQRALQPELSSSYPALEPSKALRLSSHEKHSSPRTSPVPPHSARARRNDKAQSKAVNTLQREVLPAGRVCASPAASHKSSHRA